MTRWIEKSLNALRALIAGGDLSERRLTPAHGWLLPPKAVPTPAIAAVRRAAASPKPRR